MTHHLADSTRVIAFAVAGTAVVATADLLDRPGPSIATLVVAAALLAGAFLLARTRRVALTVTEDQVVVRGLLATHTFDRDQVAGVTATHWNSFLELRDGRSVMTLLRAQDLQELSLEATVRASEVRHVASDDRELVTT